MRIKRPFIKPLKNSRLFLQEKAVIDTHNKTLIDNLNLFRRPRVFTRLYLAKKGYFLKVLMEGQEPVVQNYAKVQYKKCQVQIDRYKKQLKLKDPEF